MKQITPNCLSCRGVGDQLNSINFISELGGDCVAKMLYQLAFFGSLRFSIVTACIRINQTYLAKVFEASFLDCREDGFHFTQ